VFNHSYVPDPAQRRDPLTSPLCAPDLSGLPPALVVTAEHDLLRDEGDRYADRLAAAGVPVRHHVAPGVDHAFTHVAPTGPTRDVLDVVVDEVRRADPCPLRGPPRSTAAARVSRRAQAAAVAPRRPQVGRHRASAHSTNLPAARPPCRRHPGRLDTARSGSSIVQ
jgi:acetyl esterase/lipase